MYTAYESMRELFRQNVRLVVPRFQRRYEWRKANWASLWDDIVAGLDRLAETGEVSKHFLGAIVLTDPPAPATTGIRHIVDGQQRLTTVQLLFAAVVGVAGERKVAERHVAPLRRLTQSDAAPAGDGDPRLKLWPSRNDQSPFRAVMTRHVTFHQATDSESVVGQAYDYFVGRVQNLLAGQRREVWPTTIARLVTVLTEGLFAVVINLDPTDDPLVVFERLNAHRLPLQASDFIRNHLFAVAESQQLPADWLYDEYWARFDDEYWRESPPRAGRPRMDEFLTHFLVMERRRSFTSSRLFEEFTIHLMNTPLALEDVMARFATFGDSYRRLDTGTGLTEGEREFVERLRVLDISSLTPILLRVFGDPDADDRRATLRVLESYLIRRMIVGAPTNDYQALAATLVRQLGDTTKMAPVVRAYLVGRTARANYWPGDAEVTKALVRGPIATTLERSRLRMVLKLIDQELREPWTEPVRYDAGQLTVEHLLPVAWSEHWPPDADSRTARNELLHTLGNLTLVTHELNARLGVRPWSQKRQALHALSALRLNRQLDETWGSKAIQRRGDRLAAVLCSALESPAVPPAAPAEPADPGPAPAEPAGPEPGGPDPAGANPAGANPARASTVDAGEEPPISPLVFAFNVAMKRLHARLKEELGFDANALLDLIQHAEGLGAAQQLLGEAQPTPATRFAIAQHRTDLTVEALVLKEEFAALFSESQRAVAQARITPPAGR